MAVYILYLLSIPSAAVFALIGVIVAYATRSTAVGLARAHLDEQIRLWWIAVMWGVGLFIASMIAWALTVVLIGFPILWIIGLLYFIVLVWFTVKSLLGFIALLDGRAPR
jgi:uncharacterized membrane protein